MLFRVADREAAAKSPREWPHDTIISKPFALRHLPRTRLRLYERVYVANGQMWNGLLPRTKCTIILPRHMQGHTSDSGTKRTKAIVCQSKRYHGVVDAEASMRWKFQTHQTPKIMLMKSTPHGKPNYSEGVFKGDVSHYR